MDMAKDVKKTDLGDKLHAEVLQAVKKVDVPAEFLQEFKKEKIILNPLHLRGILLLNKAELDYLLKNSVLIRELEKQQMQVGIMAPAMSKVMSTPDPIPPAPQLLEVLKKHKVPADLYKEFANEKRLIKPVHYPGVYPLTAKQIDILRNNPAQAAALLEKKLLAVVSVTR